MPLPQMLTSDFDYVLPPDLIAREPAEPRDASRMMVLERRSGAPPGGPSGEWIDSEFRKLPEFLRATDVLVLNDTRVIRARAAGRLERAAGTNRDVEVLFATPVAENVWEVLCRPGRRIRPGDRVTFLDGRFEAVFGDRRGDGLHLLHARFAVDEFLESYGHVPLPPYIEREDTPADAVAYQTIFANAPGAIAAPTAGLHFTESILSELQAKGIEIVRITLHVGIGTFIPVRSADPARHMLKPERFHMTRTAAATLNAARRDQRRIVAVGTTSTRTLEYVIGKYGEFVETSGETDLYILPGYEFKAVGALLTNFHLPGSTLIMLASAFASREKILAAYAHAVEKRYRFYSYGDCMLIT